MTDRLEDDGLTEDWTDDEGRTTGRKRDGQRSLVYWSI